MESQTLTAALQSAEAPATSSAPETAAPATTEGHSEPVGYVGFTPDDATQQSATEAQLALVEGMSPETVVGTLDGKPITAGEVQRSFLRESDYTKKTQDLAEQRKNVEQVESWIEANRSYLERLDSGDPDQVLAALADIAQARNVQFNQAAKPRDETGRFTKAQPDELNPEEWGEARPVVEALNQSNARYAALEKKFDQLMGGLQSVQQQAEQRDAAVTIAHGWKAQGMDADVDGALALVGKPMTVEQAMRVHNLETMLRHTHKVATAKQEKPNEPGGGAARPAGDSPLSLSERLRLGIAS